jgi:hypothetical protein
LRLKFDETGEGGGFGFGEGGLDALVGEAVAVGLEDGVGDFGSGLDEG